MMEVISHLAIALVETEKSVDAAKARAGILQPCLVEERARSANVEMQAEHFAVVGKKLTYADKLKQ